jgi:hypothetical protein
VRYAVAECYSQPHPETGGQHELHRKLGERFVASESIFPVTARMTASEHSAPATDAGSLLPLRQRRHEERAQTEDRLDRANRKLTAGGGKGRHRRKALDEAKIRAWLTTQNEGFIVALEPRLSDGQKTLLRGINNDEHAKLTNLVALWQKLHQLVLLAGVLERATRKDPHHIHGAGNVRTKLDKQKLTGSLKDIPYIQSHRSEFEAS